MRRLVPWAATGLLAVAFEWLGHAGGGRAAADFAVGVAFLGCGLLLRERNRTPIAFLFVLTGVAWFLGTLDTSEIGALTSAGSVLLYVHRGPLVQLLLAYPSGRLRSRLDRVVVAAAYLDGVVVSAAQNDVLTLVLVAALVVAGVIGLRGQTTDRWRARSVATAAAALVGVSLAFVSISALTGSAQLSDAALLVIYEATLVVAAVGLTIGLLGERLRPAAFADLVVELGAKPGSASLRAALRRACGDPSLELGFWFGDAYVDERGAPLTLPAPGSERTVTIVEREGTPLAALIHDVAVAADPALSEAFAAAAGLTAANVRLQAELQAQLKELTLSRRRVVEAGDSQRRRLERRLNHAAEAHLEEMRKALLRALQAASPEVADALAVVEHELTQAVAELHRLASGIHPHTLTESGLAAALIELATGGGIQVLVEAPSERFPPPVEAAAYFVCAEALANVAKYAQADRATVDVHREDGRLIVMIEDEGVGGADPAHGSGLAGMADRVEAFGGSFAVSSPASGGTSVRAVIPLEHAS